MPCSICFLSPFFFSWFPSVPKGTSAFLHWLVSLHKLFHSTALHSGTSFILTETVLYLPADSPKGNSPALCDCHSCKNEIYAIWMYSHFWQTFSTFSSCCIQASTKRSAQRGCFSLFLFLFFFFFFLKHHQRALFALEGEGNRFHTVQGQAHKVWVIHHT